MSGVKRVLLGLAIVAVVAAGVLAAIEMRRIDAPEAPASAAVPPPPPPPPAAEPPSDPREAPATAPRFDLVRVEPDGATLVAGSTDPGDVVEVLLDSSAAARVTADGSGAFVATFDLPKGGGLIRLDLRATGELGERLSREPVFVTAPQEDRPDAAPPIVAQAGPEGVALLQAPEKPKDGPVTLDILSYSPEGAVTMQGRASPDSRVRIYAGATVIAETTASPDGDWTAQGAEGLAPGDYTLRVDELGPQGSVLSRIETPFQRAAPSEDAPRDDRIVVQPGDSLWKLSEQVYGRGLRYTVIYDSNRARIRDPDLIYPGQILELPTAASSP
ncbi:MAG: LysM peptidoglycan-binding domain-containing protein [Rubrimonas sp.]|uniref:LysM peptidoglycan-binding domain-containing protein n=1 Tax=Rubrimonas sp. TaxID=2036015 RepID=UPI002FDEC38A